MGEKVFKHSAQFSHSELIISLNYSFLFQISSLCRLLSLREKWLVWILIFLRRVTYHGTKSDVRVEKKWKQHFRRDTLPINLPVDTSGIMFLAFVRSSRIVIRVIYAETRVAKENLQFSSHQFRLGVESFTFTSPHQHDIANKPCFRLIYVF